MRDQANLTVCPECGANFDIAKNRKFGIVRKHAPFWFFDAMKQFEHHNEVKCPKCGYQYKAKEARLFIFFRSPYLVFGLCIILGLIAAIITLGLSGKLHW
jgi:uncharacterized Zn-finger protein